MNKAYNIKKGAYNRFIFKRAFSIIEMVITIAVIGILTIFVLMYYVGTLEDARITKAKIMLDQVKDACRRFYADQGFYPTEIRHLYPKYLTKIPKTPWNTAFSINFGEVTEVVCFIPLDNNQKRKMSLIIDTIGFAPDNYYDISQDARAAFSFTKTSVARASTNETQLFNVDLKIEFKSAVTAKTLDHGADFRFQVAGAEIDGAFSQEAVPIEISSLGGLEKSGFEYSSKKPFDRITVKLINCKRTSGFTFQLYRPLDEGISMYYGQRKVLLSGANSAPPIVLTRSIGESTKRK
jgi:prepilin-type N-terminal cleavage/methylation domain-containing protein